jgi:hypothetical protein
MDQQAHAGTPATPPAKRRAIEACTETIRDQCVVCIKDMNPDEEECCILQACGHMFHSGCLAPWGIRNSTCPLCRCDMVDRGCQHGLQVADHDDVHTLRRAIQALQHLLRERTTAQQMVDDTVLAARLHHLEQMGALAILISDGSAQLPSNLWHTILQDHRE